jgi:hypothetical protein
MLYDPATASEVHGHNRGEAESIDCNRRLLQQTNKPLISVFYSGAGTFAFKQLHSYPHEGKWSPF